MKESEQEMRESQKDMIRLRGEKEMKEHERKMKGA